ncbi:U3 small nucleolar RNA-associated protein 11 [Klebsormidium nitens]|uniref:U3 small nucleolar RNA-associated protein 11 n=1 Tax=Klebsormidium nitens TaxID=105231 RepID=A0A1Y1IH72_KLENI|nr:U3 small nucleolar RNA-associated protein 11 [Klebsormidium nitens]|eukprot:GAQ88086.1 U3 small nucleolar RNA-associated protein 11 [Klebsormidium nitens]
MSSLRNAVKRRTHKERSQPSDRKRFGLLEKHKDYVLRARDYHKKEEAIRVLKEKAASRNPDEFYFKMQNSQTVGGIHIGRKDEKNKYTQEQLRLMKTQDIGYVLNRAQEERKKVERMQATLHGLGRERQNKKVLFVDEGEDVGDRLPSGSGQQEDGSALSVLPKRIEKRRQAAYRELRERKERAESMSHIANKMLLQKELMGKGRKRKLTPEEVENPGKGSVFKWKRERKK